MGKPNLCALCGFCFFAIIIPQAGSQPELHRQGYRTILPSRATHAQSRQELPRRCRVCFSALRVPVAYKPGRYRQPTGGTWRSRCEEAFLLHWNGGGMGGGGDLKGWWHIYNMPGIQALQHIYSMYIALRPQLFCKYIVGSDWTKCVDSKVQVHTRCWAFLHQIFLFLYFAKRKNAYRNSGLCLNGAFIGTRVASKRQPTPSKILPRIERSRTLRNNKIWFNH